MSVPEGCHFTRCALQSLLKKGRAGKQENSQKFVKKEKKITRILTMHALTHTHTVQQKEVNKQENPKPVLDLSIYFAEMVQQAEKY